MSLLALVTEPPLAPRGRMIGRDRELAQILPLLSRRERLCTLIGWAGQGKTRLARAVADAWRNEVASLTVRFVDLSQPDAQQALERAFIVREPTLIVVDSAESIDPAMIQQIASGLDRTPLAVVLATARAPLGLSTEIRYWLPPLDLESGVELFLDRAETACAGREIDRSAVEQIVRMLGGHPLSIELCAGMCDVLSPQELLVRLERRFEILKSDAPELPERHRSIEASITGSWERLLPAEREGLIKCADVGDSFCAEQTSVSLDVLRSLVQKSFLLPIADDMGERCFIWSPNVRAWLMSQRTTAAVREVTISMEMRTVRYGRRAIVLRRRRAPWLIFTKLVEMQEMQPGAALDVKALTEAGWPNERISAEAAAARVYFVVRELRKAGLTEVLLTVAEGYLLDPSVRIVRV